MTEQQKKQSDFGAQTIITNADGTSFDLNKDYTKAINDAKAAGQDTTQLEAERQAKINSSAYGGVHKTGNQNASVGGVYNENATVVNRTSNQDPIVIKQTTKQESAVEPYTYTPQFQDYLDKWLTTAQQQQTAQIDYATNTGVNELVRAEQDAQGQFQTQRNQIAIDEAKAKDNQALYAEARGDKGGIGAAQYDSIMNTAAQNRLAVNSAQTKLATDTSRQIADLRAKGEFEKADALLTLSQQYLSQLISLEQWAAEFGLSVAQFNASLQQWQSEFELAVGETMGTYQGSPTLGAQQFEFDKQMTQKNQLSEDGWLFLQSGIMPSASQLEAMGMTAEQAQTVLTQQKLAASSKGSGGGSGSGSGSKSSAVEGSGVEDLFYDAMSKGGEAPWTWIKNNYKKYGLTSQPEKSEWETYQKGHSKVNYDSGIGKYSYTSLRSAVEKWLASGLYDSAAENIETFWPQMNETQRIDMEKLFRQYGFEY